MGVLFLRLTRIHRYIFFAVLLLPPDYGYAAQKIEFAIKDQALASALTEYAAQANLQILFRTEELPSIEIEPLVGSYTVTEAIAKLLGGSGLQYTFGGNNAIVVHKPGLTSVGGGHDKNQSAQELRIERLYVTGMRHSLEQSLQIKKQASVIIEVITAEDVGKFPDKNVADSLQRVPGVSVDRVWGEGRDINVRGTDKDVNRTLMNGQNVASAYWWANDNPSRGFNYSILASELIASLEVHKSPASDIDEGSIGGTVIIRTRKPMNLDAGTISASIQEQYSELPEKWDPQASILYSWKNAEKNFGVLVSIDLQNRQMRRDGLEAFPDNTLYTITDQNGKQFENVYVPWGIGSAIFQQDRRRETGNVTLQWLPSNQMELTMNTLVAKMNMDNSNQNYLSLPGHLKLNESPPVSVTNPRFGRAGDGNLTLLGGTMGNAASTGAVLEAIARDSFVETAVYDLDFIYTFDHSKLHAQVGKTRATGGSEHDFLYQFSGDTRENFNLGPNQAEFNFPDLDPLDASSLNRLSSESRDWIRQMQDDEVYFQVDLELDVAIDFVESIKFGVKFRNHTIENQRFTGTIDTSHPDWLALSNISLAQVSSGITPELHQEVATVGSLTQFAWLDLELAGQVINPFFSNGVMVYATDLNAYYEINEEISAFYTKVNFAFENWQGNVGVRAVETQQKSKAYQNNLIQTNSRDYTNILPSINLRYDLKDDVILRASASKVMARPTFPNLSSNVILDATTGTGKGGNSDLKPFNASQIDLGFEWYFSNASILSSMAFYKDISTFIFLAQQAETIDEQVVNVTRPNNAPGADIYGLEVQWQQDLAKGFGVMVNYTYTNATVTSQSGLQKLKLPGNSKDQFNASLYFENKNINARLSHNYRSESFGRVTAGSQDVTDEYAQWDGTLTWHVKEEFSTYMEVINITNEPIFLHTESGIPQGLYENGRRLIIGVKMSL